VLHIGITMLSVIMLNVAILNVVAPQIRLKIGLCLEL
jgi:hypothetical protein